MNFSAPTIYLIFPFSYFNIFSLQYAEFQLVELFEKSFDEALTSDTALQPMFDVRKNNIWQLISTDHDGVGFLSFCNS